MSIQVEFPPTRAAEPGKGTAGLRTQIGGAVTTVSGIRNAVPGLVKRSIG